MVALISPIQSNQLLGQAFQTARFLENDVAPESSFLLQALDVRYEINVDVWWWCLQPRISFCYGPNLIPGLVAADIDIRAIKQG